jgi:hypothetical protein
MLAKVHIIGGGTVAHVRNHLALCAPAYGTTARALFDKCLVLFNTAEVVVHLSKMAAMEDSGSFETWSDLSNLLDEIVEDPRTKVIFFNAAVVDFQGYIEGEHSGKYKERLKSYRPYSMELKAVPKLVNRVRKERKDIFLISFKTTCGLSEQAQYLAGLELLKRSSSNLVLANDVQTRTNMIITPEEAAYHVTKDRDEALDCLVQMANLRSHLTFTQSTVVAGEPVSWLSPEIPASLRTVVDFCIANGAYKQFHGATAGHFAAKLSDTEFLTSRRKSNFNNLQQVGMVKIKSDSPDTVLAYGSKPSVGGQSQRIVFKDHPGLDCIVHFHCLIKDDSSVPRVSQEEFECGSHECGANTSRGLGQFGNIWAVYLINHGPNVVFHSSVDPVEVMDFITANFDLSIKSGGYQLT